ncbi:MAG: zinc-dependent metalloprotease [Arachnia propionica]|uniref:zinc-dependent metalloprotease n=1 Tax=Arachnia propionica TaxID=1750 RepID=UPI0026FA94CA|nr:zinc-dependent metalloprotease [Arachnia propionica]
MTRRPHVAWPVALHLARLAADPGPEVSRPEAIRTVAALRLAARRAGELVVEHAGLGGAAAGEVLVLDRAGWARSAATTVERMLDRLPFPQRPEGAWRRLSGVGNAVVAAGALVLGGRVLLGQYDPFTGRLVLVAPGIVELQRRHRLELTDLALWVGLHEQTHAVQFSAAPWLLGHVEALLVELVRDDPGVVTLLSAQGRVALERLGAVMTLLEGHADFVAGRAAVGRVPTSAALQRVFERPAAGRGWRRWLGGLDKAVQYRAGLGFCRAVARRAGAEALRAAFAGPEQLPSAREIADPTSWLRRVHGQA